MTTHAPLVTNFGVKTLSLVTVQGPTATLVTGNRGASTGGRGTLWDLTPETRVGSALHDALMIGSTVASPQVGPLLRGSADPCSAPRRAITAKLTAA